MVWSKKHHRKSEQENPLKENGVCHVTIRAFLTLLCLVPNLGHTTTTTTGSGPKVYVPGNVYEFEPVLEGSIVISRLNNIYRRTVRLSPKDPLSDTL